MTENPYICGYCREDVYGSLKAHYPNCDIRNTLREKPKIVIVEKDFRRNPKNLESLSVV